MYTGQNKNQTVNKLLENKHFEALFKNASDDSELVVLFVKTMG